MIVAFQTTDPCGTEPDAVCRFIFDQTDSEVAAQLAGWLSVRVSAIVIVLVLAYITIRLIRRSAPKAEAAWVSRQTAEAKRLRPAGLSPEQQHLAQLHIERTAQRAHTMRLVASSVLGGIVWFIATLILLDQLGVNLAPLIAGAGVVGIALGFGAQRMVQDFLAGIFIVLEDQYGVGDYVDVGEASGVVEQVNLRSTRLRDVSGVVWYVPNGQIVRVANMSQLWSKAILDISVSYDCDVEAAGRVLKATADEMWQSQGVDATIIEEPQYLGVERFEADGVALRLIIKTEPNEQWAAARELRGRIKTALDQASIEIPYPQRTIRVRSE